MFDLMPQFRGVSAFAVAAGTLIGMGALAVNADQTGVAPPQGSALLLEVTADGVQIYTCEAKGNLFEWSFKAPEANLFDKQGRQIGTHFAGPTWKMADGSAIVGELAARTAHGRAGCSCGGSLYPPDGDQGRSRADNRLRRKPYLRAGAHAFGPESHQDLRHLPASCEAEREGREEQSRRNPESIGRFDPVTF
jgi:hypothetical protein